MHAPADWYPDPTDRNAQRWWDGRSWSEHVFSDGVQSMDPLGDEVEAAPSTDRETADDDPAPGAAPAPATGGAGDAPEAAAEQTSEVDVLRAHVDAMDFFTPRTPPPPLPYPVGAMTADDATEHSDDDGPIDDRPEASDAEAGDDLDEDDDLDDLEPWSMRADAPEARQPSTSSSGFAGDVFVMPAATVQDLTARRQGPPATEDHGHASAPASPDPEPEPAPDRTPEPVNERTPGRTAEPAPEPAPEQAPDPERLRSSVPAPQGPPTVEGLGSGDPLGIRGAILGDEDAAPQDRVRVDNRRLLRCALDDRSGAVARLGTIVATQGVVELSVVGATRWAHRKRAPSLPLVRTTGSGDVFFADDSQHVTLLQLSGSGSGLVTRAEALLAFDNLLGWGVEHSGDPELAPDLMTVQVHGDGWIALLSDGEPIALPTEGRPTFVDLHALVAWSGALRMRVIRSGPTQDVQVAFEGHGVVIVQPSPGMLLE